MNKIEITKQLKELAMNAGLERALIKSTKDKKKIVKINREINDEEVINKIKEINKLLIWNLKALIKLLVASTGEIKKQVDVVYKKREEISKVLELLEMRMQSFTVLIGESKDNIKKNIDYTINMGRLRIFIDQAGFIGKEKEIKKA
ncbi:hypothetical protein [Rickettsiales endosymbiont of Trichoplax sp. H2]|uniref:hypothetical protein n=1 Tax=Rickettsiales endosymbiont of Trichoplax sp. H2 TaxID=2021221 RepID=UPI0012B1EF5F|nr:hypothetical protein [Rickettsiales endosymbiont of Trichoplax sp. H2]MSO13508.1 hypothetical protein [Rickettsiales endosymbiont of Trichoplax sp. H2]